MALATCWHDDRTTRLAAPVQICFRILSTLITRIIRIFGGRWKGELQNSVGAICRRPDRRVFIACGASWVGNSRAESSVGQGGRPRYRMSPTSLPLHGKRVLILIGGHLAT